MGSLGWLDAEIVAPPALRAGDGADLSLILRSTSSSVEAVHVEVHGLAGAHLGLPAARVVLRPGRRRLVTARLQVPTSATSGRHQLVLELRRHADPDDSRLVHFEVEILAAPVPVVSLRRRTIRRRGRVRVENPSDEPIRVTLTGSVNGASFRFRPTVLDLAPGVRGTARLRATSRTRFGRRPATIRAATANASAWVEATVVGRSRSAPFVAAIVGVVALVSAVILAVDDPSTEPDLEPAAARGIAADDEVSAPAEAGGGAVSPSSADSPEVAGAGREPGSTSIPGATASTPGVIRPPGAAPPGAGGGPGAGPAGDCTTPDGLTGWAVRGRVVSEGVVASVAARPAGRSADFAATVTTDEDGFFTICPLSLGDYLVTALAEGYYPLVIPARVTGVSADLGVLELQPGAATLIGIVRGPSGPIEGANVVVRVGRREVGRATTDATGEYLVIGVPAPSEVTVEISALGLAAATFSSEVLTDGRIRQPEIHLEPS